MTDYIVLSKDDSGFWTKETLAPSARSARSAIQAVLTQNGNREGEYVAVPFRSWRPVTVKVETKTALKFS